MFPSPSLPNGSMDSQGQGTLRVLIVDADPRLRENCSALLLHEGHQVSSCGRAAEARELVRRYGFDVLFIDLDSPQVAPLELLGCCAELQPRPLAVMLTANPNVEASIDAMRAGAWDYLPKPFTAVQIRLLLGRAQHTLAASRAPGGGGNGLAAEHAAPTLPRGPLGRSPAFLRAIHLARRVAQTDASVFITGESGVGKEVIAQFIHQNSRRRARPMVAINCAALPESLLESEMFGHVKGAFTGATRDKAGLLEAADGSSLFLDELTEMSLPIQAKLLRVLQDGLVRRVGSESVDARVNVRLVAATNRNPWEATEEGVLRRDLYYRLAVVLIHVPPLRQRLEDIPLLAHHFLELYWKKHRETGLPMPSFSDEAMAALLSRSWRGNVRELQNVVEHAVVLLEPGAVVTPDDLPHLDDPYMDDEGRNRCPWPAAVLRLDYHAARDQVLAEFENAYLTTLLGRSRGNLSFAAKSASINRSTLYRLLEKHGLEKLTSFRSPPEAEED